MKISQFNVFFFHDNNVIGYNGYSDEFIIINPELYDIFLAANKNYDWKGLFEIHPTFYESLVLNGFLVDELTDEVENVRKVVLQIDQENEKHYSLTINPTMNCNFKCWYCYETHIKASKMTSETIKRVVKHVNNTLNDMLKLESFDLSWFGGEPLLYFDKSIVPILKQIKPLMDSRGLQFSSGFTTNGFLINQDMLDICKVYNANSFQITLDGHRERHNQVRYVSKERGSYDEIVSNIKLCLNNEFFVSVRVNISNETLYNVMEIANDFKDLNNKDKMFLKFSFHEVWQEEKEITQDIQEVVNNFRSLGLNTLYKGVNNDSVRNSCYADKKYQATINYNGDVFKCTARDFESANREGVLNENGVIDWNDKFEKRMNSKFNNAPCLSCKLLPICNGGCSQQALEHDGKDYCVYNFNEESKTNVVKDRYLYLIS